MDIEQLKLVLETLQSVGHEAGSLATLWLWLKFSGGLLQLAFWAAVIVGVAHAIARAARHLEGDARYERFLREMRGTLGTGTSGVMTDDEYGRTTAMLRQLAEEHRAKKAAN